MSEEIDRWHTDGGKEMEQIDDYEFCIMNGDDFPITEPYRGEGGFRAMKVRLEIYREQYPKGRFDLASRRVTDWVRISSE